MDPPAHNSTAITRDWQAQRWSFYWACKAPDNFQILLNYECLRFAKPSEKSHRWNLKDGIFTCHFIYALGYLLLSNHTRLWILLRSLSADTFSWFKEYKMKTWFMISIKFIPGSIIGSINYSFIYSSHINWEPALGQKNIVQEESIISRKKTEAVPVSWIF